MPTVSGNAAAFKKPILFWVGWVLSVLPAAMLVMSAAMKFNMPEEFKTQTREEMGWNPDVMPKLGVVELACTILYLVPQTSILGAILLTGYMGGAIATHVRVGDPFLVQLLIGVAVWLGIFLREPRLRAILPWRT